MPSLQKHIELSLKRTGKEYREIHEWMDGRGISYKDKLERHKITNIPGFLPFIEKRFGKDAAEEYLKHIEDDYDNNFAIRLMRTLKSFLVKR